MILKKKKVGGLPCPDFKTYDKATVVKLCGTGISIDIGHRIENQRTL